MVQRLDELGIKTVDHLIITNPSLSHMNGAKAVMENFEVRSLIMPDMPESEMNARLRSFVRSLKSMSNDLTLINKENAGKVIDIYGASIKLLTPLTVKYIDDPDCYSIAIRLCYGETAFLFMSHIREEDEQLLISKNIKADVLAVTRNTGDNVNSDEFINAVSPEYAILTSLDEQLNLLNKETRDKLENKGINVINIRDEGTAVFVTDSKTVTKR